MNAKRRLVMCLAAVLPIAAHAACSASNGDAIPSQVFDASALDVGTNPDDPDGGGNGGGKDANGNDGAMGTDAPSDAPAESGPNDAAVQINEIFVDNAGLGDGAELVELRAAAGTPVDDLKLRLIHADGQVKYEVSVGDPGAKVGTSGLWVVGGGSDFKLNVQSHVDKTVSLSTWGLDNAHGAVQLVRGTTLLDVVGYTMDADAGTLAPPASPPLATVEGKPATVPAAPPAPPPPAKAKGLSFGRKTGGADTNDNAADFCTMEASPGFAQKPCK
ncbi:MAG: hypothetical protein JWP87_528 [Labilithrix sp.]|nr:hypothetical protein [Labilithrix sp.]